MVVTGSTGQLHVTYNTDYSTGNKIAEYTYVADDITSQTILECTCDSPQYIPCHLPVSITLEGMFLYITGD